MKKVISTFVLSMLMVQATYGSVAPQQKLLNAYQELNYRLEVEWDQESQEMRNKIVSDFHKTLVELRKEGVSNKDLLLSLKNAVLSKQGAQELDSIIKTIETGDLTDTEVNQIVNSFAQELGKEGSQFSSGATAAIVIGVVAIAAAVVLVVYLTTREPTPNPNPDPTPDPDPTPVSYTCTAWNNVGQYFWWTSTSQSYAYSQAASLCYYNTAYYNVCYTPTCVANY